MTWLDAQPLKSIIDVSFGSIATMAKNERMEFWYGIWLIAIAKSGSYGSYGQL